jgi:hypothetical protein
VTSVKKHQKQQAKAKQENHANHSRRVERLFIVVPNLLGRRAPLSHEPLLPLRLARKPAGIANLAKSHHLESMSKQNSTPASKKED